MNIFNLFTKTPSITAEELKKKFQDLLPGGYNLIDVREDSEYRKGHIPGARLIPIRQLHERLNEINPARPTYIY